MHVRVRRLQEKESSRMYFRDQLGTKFREIGLSQKKRQKKGQCGTYVRSRCARGLPLA